MRILATANDRDIFARTLWGEVRGESHAGKIAVAWVIRNRMEIDLGNDGKPDWWGEGIAGVCKKQGQFSCWNKGDVNLPKLRAVTIADPAFRECMAVVDEVLAGRVPDPTKGSTHYHTTAVRPSWIKGVKPVVKIGAHLFYNNVR